MAQTKRIKDSIECWLLRRAGTAHRVILLRVGGRPGQHPDFLQPVTGGIKTGESAEEACIREVHEETGLELSANELQRVPELFEVVIDDSLTVRKSLFYAEIASDHVHINPNEHVGWELSDIELVESKLHWQSNKATWAAIRVRLQAGA